MARMHIAIMRKSWGLAEKILSGEKTIESRWYKNKYRPWGNIGREDTVYFKDSGGPVKIKAKVSKVLQFEGLTSSKVKELLRKYSKANGLGVGKGEIEKYYQVFKDKRYCILIFLKDVEPLEPFDIDKTGFGARASWLTVDGSDKVKK